VSCTSLSNCTQASPCAHNIVMRVTSHSPSDTREYSPSACSSPLRLATAQRKDSATRGHFLPVNALSSASNACCHPDPFDCAQGRLRKGSPRAAQLPLARLATFAITPAQAFQFRPHIGLRPIALSLRCVRDAAAGIFRVAQNDGSSNRRRQPDNESLTEY